MTKGCPPITMITGGNARGSDGKLFVETVAHEHGGPLTSVVEVVEGGNGRFLVQACDLRGASNPGVKSLGVAVVRSVCTSEVIFKI